MPSSLYIGFAEREERARKDFAETLIKFAPSLDQATAERLTDWYLKKRLAKIDRVIGRISVKHGAYLDHDEILAQAKAMG